MTGAYLGFFLVIFLANIIQGITGFAGTVLAMPFSMELVGYEVAKPVLNVLGFLSGVYVFSGNHKSVNWKELVKIVVTMLVGMSAGFFLTGYLMPKEALMYKLLGSFVVVLGAYGLMASFYRKKKKEEGEEKGKTKEETKEKNPLQILLLPLAGLVHGIFVCGGPLLIGYLTTRIKDKTEFRATISTVWIFLNGLIFVEDVKNGMWNVGLEKVQLCSIPFLLLGMYLGSRLVKKMSQDLFMKITYVLLMISGLSLFVK